MAKHLAVTLSQQRVCIPSIRLLMVFSLSVLVPVHSRSWFSRCESNRSSRGSPPRSSGRQHASVAAISMLAEQMRPGRPFRQRGVKGRSNKEPVAARSTSPEPAPASLPTTPSNTSIKGSEDCLLGSKMHLSSAISISPSSRTTVSDASSFELNTFDNLNACPNKPQSVLLAEGPDFCFELISQCELPTERGLFNLRAYRYSKHGKEVEPVVLFRGDLRDQGDVFVRVHDQCLTSEVLGSRRCDCKEQLEKAMERMASMDRGMLVYLPQEGRGIGLANKVAAYNLQDQGLDTVDANLFLGFGEDERSYDYVPYIIQDFGVRSIRLATNNPFKIKSLRKHGVQITSVEPIQVPMNAYNRHYIKTKAMRMEHALDCEDEGAEPNVAIALMKDLPSQKIDETFEASTDAAPRYCLGRETVLAAVQAIREGRMVVVVDDEDRENEGDIIMAADAVTTEAMAFIVRHCSGVVCVAMEGEELDRLALPPMVANSEDPKKTAFTVSVDCRVNTTTGISARDRAATCQKLASPEAVAADFTRPGHIFPLRYRDGGVLRRRGHTEASVDLARLAGRRPASILCEICSEDGSMARLTELRQFVKKHDMIITSIADLVAFRIETEGNSSGHGMSSRKASTGGSGYPSGQNYKRRN